MGAAAVAGGRPRAPGDVGPRAPDGGGLRGPRHPGVPPGWQRRGRRRGLGRGTGAAPPRRLAGAPCGAAGRCRGMPASLGR
eukprot:4260022-Lingulodinium_polyedra.AAC.1